MTQVAHTIEPLSVDTWDAFAGLVERHDGIFGGCWCTYLHDCPGRAPGDEAARWRSGSSSRRASRTPPS